MYKNTYKILEDNKIIANNRYDNRVKNKGYMIAFNSIAFFRYKCYINTITFNTFYLFWKRKVGV